MTTRRLVESDVNLVIAHLKASLPAILSALRTQRDDAAVTTEPPKSYYISPNQIGYKLPAVFVIADSMDFTDQSTGPNFVNAVTSLNVTVLVEDQNAEKVTIKAYRYFAALQEALAQTNLASDDGAVKLFVRVERIENSPLYSDTREGEKTRFFRKEVVLYCKVEHKENY